MKDQSSAHLDTDTLDRATRDLRHPASRDPDMGEFARRLERVRARMRRDGLASESGD